MPVFKIPSEFELAGRTWKVKKLTSGAHETHAKDIDPEKYILRGLCVPEEASIFLLTNRPHEAMVHTFLHELGHAMLDHMGVKMEEEDEEIFVNQLADLLQQFMKSQKGSFK